MPYLAISPRLKKACALICILLLTGTLTAQAQKKKKQKNTTQNGNVFQQLTSNIYDLTNLIKSVKALIAVTKMPTAQYDKRVTVVKGTKGKTNVIPKDIPADDITKPKFEDDKFTNLTWTPVSFFEGQLFPSSIICMATYKEPLEGKLDAISRPIGFRIISKHSNIPLNWEIECEEGNYFKKIKGSVFYKDKDKIMDLMPEVDWNYETLSKHQASTPISVIFRMSDKEGHKVEQVEHLYLRSVNDCIYRYGDLDMSFLFTGYIQEEHPEIEKIIKDAVKTKMVKNINGYQSDDEAVNMQVAAIWRVLHDRGFNYSDVTQTAGTSDKLESQSVRTFANSIKNNQANCVDGSVVFASILRKIGISTVLVVTSDHCFLGYYTDRGKQNIYYLETTMLGESDLINAAPKAGKNAAYKKEFDLARKRGGKEYDEYKAKDDIVEIDVDEMRKKVKPIPFYKD